MVHGVHPLLLRSAIYGDGIAVEYYIQAFLDEDGTFFFCSPTWTTLLVRKNDRVYPLHSMGANRFVMSITGGKFFGDESYTIWVKTSGPDGFVFYEYAYDSEKGAFIETITHIHISGTWPESTFNVRMDHSLGEIHRGEVTFGR